MILVAVAKIGVEVGVEYTISPKASVGGRKGVSGSGTITVTEQTPSPAFQPTGHMRQTGGLLGAYVKEFGRTRKLSFTKGPTHPRKTEGRDFSYGRREAQVLQAL